VKTSRTRECLSIGLFISALILLSADSGGQNQDSATGELKFEGQCIEKLVLWSGGGSRKQFDQLGESLTLPVGTYTLTEVHLKGGYVSQIRRPLTVTVTTDKPAVLKVGAPLRQSVKVERRGSLLVLNYELSGAGQEKYTGGSRSKPPTFAVYKGEKKIASGKFEFG
jgi:hypothetical protein